MQCLTPPFAVPRFNTPIRARALHYMPDIHIYVVLVVYYRRDFIPRFNRSSWHLKHANRKPMRAVDCEHFS